MSTEIPTAEQFQKLQKELAKLKKQCEFYKRYAEFLIKSSEVEQ